MFMNPILLTHFRIYFYQPVSTQFTWLLFNNNTFRKMTVQETTNRVSKGQNGYVTRPNHGKKTRIRNTSLLAR